MDKLIKIIAPTLLISIFSCFQVVGQDTTEYTIEAAIQEIESSIREADPSRKMQGILLNVYPDENFKVKFFYKIPNEHTLYDRYTISFYLSSIDTPDTLP